MQAYDFLEQNHIQGGVMVASKGLYYKGMLVALGTFVKRNGDYNLIRYCNKINYSVRGGLSKILATFEVGTKIFTFSDNRWSQGNLYKTLGFTMTKEIPPDYKYFKTNISYHKSNFRIKRILARYPQFIGTNKTESQMMGELGYDRVWDCGKKKWELIIQ